jgi:hypothetical protein
MVKLAMITINNLYAREPAATASYPTLTVIFLSQLQNDHPAALGDAEM